VSVQCVLGKYVEGVSGGYVEGVLGRVRSVCWVGM
jgi:hypothetical protein